VVLLEHSQIVLSLDRIDITLEAVRRLDAEMTVDEEPPEPEPPAP
jgi:hypothetical protein